MGHRSANAPANTTTYHIVDAKVAGFIACRVGQEELDDRINIFFSVEYVYVMQEFRMRGLGKQLLKPPVQEVQALCIKSRMSAAGRACISSQQATRNPWVAAIC